MIPASLRALCVLLLGGLAAFAQETKTLHTFDRLPFVPTGAPTVTYGNNNWLPNTDTNPPATPRPNRRTYEGLELGDNANTNGSFTLTFPAPLDLSRFERIEITAAALPFNTLNRFNLKLASGSGTGLRRTVHYAGTAPLTRHGDKLGFAFNAPNRWHRDASPVDYSAITSIRLSGDWAQNPGAARLIIRELVAVNNTLLDPAHFPAERILGSSDNSWYGSRIPQNGRIVIGYPAVAREAGGAYGSLYFRYANAEVKDERDLTPYTRFTVDAATLPGNETDLRLELRSIGGGASHWILPRETFGAAGATVVFDLRAPANPASPTSVNLSRVSGISLSAVGNSSTIDVRWSLGAIKLVPSTPAVFTFRRGLNMSHWMAQLLDKAPPDGGFAPEARLNDDLLGHIASLTRGNVAGGLRAFDHIRIPVAYDEAGELGTSANGPVFNLTNDFVGEFELAVGLARARGLGVILDLHSLPGLAMGTTHTLFDPVLDASGQPMETTPLQAQAIAVWSALATRFANEGPWLRFELMNEPSNDTIYGGFPASKAQQVAEVQEKLRRAVRQTNPNRVIYVTTNNKGNIVEFYGPQRSQPGYTGWGDRPENLDSIPAFGWDKNIAYTIHYYEPYGLTHFGLNGLNTVFSGDQIGAALNEGGAVATAFAKLRSDIINPATGDDDHYLMEYREIHVGEFGITKMAFEPHMSPYNEPTDAFRLQGFENVREHFMYRVRNEAEKHGFAWCAWDYYVSDFSVFNADGADYPDVLPDPNAAGRALLRP